MTGREFLLEEYPFLGTSNWMEAKDFTGNEVAKILDKYYEKIMEEKEESPKILVIGNGGIDTEGLEALRKVLEDEEIKKTGFKKVEPPITLEIQEPKTLSLQQPNRKTKKRGFRGQIGRKK